MAVSTSTAFREAILGPTAFDTMFANGCIQIRSGLQPASADDAATGELLGLVTRNGGAWAPGNPANGLQFVRQGATVQKPEADVWLLRGLAAGTATWFRLIANALDAGGESTSALRIDGAIGLIDGPGNAQMLLPTTVMSSDTTIQLSSWWFILP